MRALVLVTLLRASSAVDIIVVGGGISGLAAARALVDESCVAKFSVKVLEAESRIGGRT
jgi:cation diffusion facilitator CzcD-associated flavoprotein CzcO